MDRAGTRVAQVRRPTKVTESWNPTYVKVSFVNFVRHKATYREERACLSVKGRVYEEISRGLQAERRAMLPPKELMVVLRGTTRREEHSKATNERPEVHKVQNPTAQNLGRVTHEAKSARETKRGSKAAGDIGEVAVSRAKNHTRTIAETEGRAIR